MYIIIFALAIIGVVFAIKKITEFIFYKELQQAVLLSGTITDEEIEHIRIWLEGK